MGANINIQHRHSNLDANKYKYYWNKYQCVNCKLRMLELYVETVEKLFSHSFEGKFGTEWERSGKICTQPSDQINPF